MEEPRRRLTRFEWACLAVVGLAFLARVPFIFAPHVIWDSAWYLMLARSFSETGTFLLPWSNPGAPQYSGYWPPLYPIYLSPLVKLLGASYATLLVGALSATALLCVVVFFTTRDLFDRTRAFAATALVAANPAFLTSDSSGSSETLLATMVVLTVWAYVRSLTRPAWLGVAGVFALLAYLGKANLGLPFVLAGVALVGAFRIRTRGLKRVATSPLDIGIAFTALAALLTFSFTRTGKLGGVGLGFIEPLREILSQPLWLPVFVFKVAFAGAFLLAITLPVSLHALEAWRARQGEREGTLWLAVGLPLLLGAVFTTSFFFSEERTLVDFDNIRYLTPGIVPFLWLMLQHYRWDGGERPEGVADMRLHRRHVTAYSAAVALLAGIFLLNPMAPVGTLTRLFVFLLLALGPLALAGYVLTTHYRVASRTQGREQERRLMSAPAHALGGRTFFAAALVGPLLAFFVSAWYAYVALALAVASTAMSPRARVIGLTILVLSATVPDTRTSLPLDAILDALDEALPEGGRVALGEPAVYFSAVAPEGLSLTIYRGGDVPPDVDAILLQASRSVPEGSGFVVAREFHYGIQPYPTSLVELWLEKLITGETPRDPGIVAYRLYVRETPNEASVAT